MYQTPLPVAEFRAVPWTPGHVCIPFKNALAPCRTEQGKSVNKGGLPSGCLPGSNRMPGSRASDLVSRSEMSPLLWHVDPRHREASFRPEERPRRPARNPAQQLCLACCSNASRHPADQLHLLAGRREQLRRAQIIAWFDTAADMACDDIGQTSTCMLVCPMSSHLASLVKLAPCARVLAQISVEISSVGLVWIIRSITTRSKCLYTRIYAPRCLLVANGRYFYKVQAGGAEVLAYAQSQTEGEKACGAAAAPLAGFED